MKHHTDYFAAAAALQFLRSELARSGMYGDYNHVMIRYWMGQFFSRRESAKLDHGYLGTKLFLESRQDLLGNSRRRYPIVKIARLV